MVDHSIAAASRGPGGSDGDRRHGIGGVIQGQLGDGWVRRVATLTRRCGRISRII